jgi:hypothetical protein
MEHQQPDSSEDKVLPGTLFDLDESSSVHHIRHGASYAAPSLVEVRSDLF